MKIIKFSASNVLRIKAVEITPDGTLQVITGKNAAGKSSVLNAIFLALSGGTAAREIKRPIRDGEESAEVTLDLGDIVVTRTWDDKGTKLVVKAADGATYKSPQTLLDQLVGKLSFDPLAFTRLSARDQREALLDLLGLDFTDADRERARLYDNRLEIGRRAHSFGDLPKLEKGAPVTETPAVDVLDRISRAQHEQRAIDSLHAANARALDQIERYGEQIKELQRLKAEMQQVLSQNMADLDRLPEPEDTNALRDELASIEDRNRTARENARILRDREAQKAHEETYAELGRAIAVIDASKAKAIAEANMPVDGLGFDEQGVTFNGVPFSQASSAEQIRVSLGMAMALNPTLRVIRIMDGSLLDSDSMAEIVRMAEAADAQIWVERVEDDSEAAVLIEDGSVVQR